MQAVDQLERMNAQELREFAARLITEIADTRREISIKQLTHEMAILKRWKFAARSEQLHGAQRDLFEETVDADLEAIGLEIEALKRVEQRSSPKATPRRVPLPASLPRREVRHEPENTTCSCGCQMKRIGEDVSEKLDYVPGVFSVERHIRGKWACANCERIVQAPVAPHVIDKGIPTAGLIAQVLVSKYTDHLPLYRQEGIFGRAG
ncbi:MAG: IS66 family transposase zinc-finger binding domain-containing protein, partial [Gammaproteobacteria bacterium]